MLTGNMAFVTGVAQQAVAHGVETTEHGVLSSVHGHVEEPTPDNYTRSSKFKRLGSIAINTTPCLHDSSSEILTGFTCEHDIYDAYLNSHGRGAHFGSAVDQFYEYFANRWGESPEMWEKKGIESAAELRNLLLSRYGVDQPTYDAACSAKEDPYANANTLAPGLPELSMRQQIVVSAMCRFAPYFDEDEQTETWQADYHEGHNHESGEDDHEHGLFNTGKAYSDVEQASHLVHPSHEDGIHGIDINTELNWAYAALPHQSEIAVVNLNVVDWGKVARFENETGFKVLLFDDKAPFDDEALLNYASNMLLSAYGHEKQLTQALDTVHRYCFEEAGQRWDEKGIQRPWTDDLGTPPGIEDRNRSEDWNVTRLTHAIEFFRQETTVPAVENPPPDRMSGWSCLWYFTGVYAATWTDRRFTNEYCWYDTQRLSRYDEMHSPGEYSRSNTVEAGDGDAWRCDWFIRYIEVSKDIELDVTMPVAEDVGHDLPLDYTEGHSGKDQNLTVVNDILEGTGTDFEWIQRALNISIGPHDLDYNPHNGLVYASHYWLLNDPDVRMLPDWTIHAIDQNPASPAFNNPWDTRRGPTPLSKNSAFLGGRSQMAAVDLNSDEQLLFGGETDGYLSDEIVRHRSNSRSIHEERNRLPTERTAVSAVFNGSTGHDQCPDGCAYVIGGRQDPDSNGDGVDDRSKYLDEILWYNPKHETLEYNRTWENTTVPPDRKVTNRTVPARLPSARAGTATAWTGDVAYVFGGVNETGRLPDIVRYDPSTNTTETLPVELPMPLSGSAAVWSGDQAYLFGGRTTDGNRTDAVIAFDPAAGSAQVVSRLPYNLTDASAVFNGTEAFLFGGSNSTDFTDDVIAFAPGGQPRVVAEMPSARTQTAAAFNGSHAFVYGGLERGQTNEVVQYFPENNNVTVREPDTRGTRWMRSEAYPIDVGGPLSGLHPVTVDVNDATGEVLVANRDANTLAILEHDGGRDFVSDYASARLQGPIVLNVQQRDRFFHNVSRNFAFYEDETPNAIPTGQDMQGYFEGEPPNITANDTNCELLASIDEIDNRTVADDLCQKQLLDTTAMNLEGVRSELVNASRERLQTFVLEQTGWAELREDLRGLVGLEGEALERGVEDVEDEWFPRLTDPEDRALLEKRLEGLRTVRAEDRVNATNLLLTGVADRLPGQIPEFLDDLDQTLYDVLRAGDFDGTGNRLLGQLFTKYQASARNGTLVGMQGDSLDLAGFGDWLSEKNPVVGGTIPRMAEWLAYCVGYVPGKDLPELLQQANEGVDPQTKAGCDGTGASANRTATQAKIDFLGTSNNHHVFILRDETVIQPFDIWVNPQNGNIWSSVLGNHDNLPIVEGWLAMFSPCLGDFTRPLKMGIKPHHVNINPYSEEVVGGHLVSDFIHAAQFQCERIYWSITKGLIYGSDTLPDAAPVPVMNATGMGVNPSTQRLFFTRFGADEQIKFPETGQHEQSGNYMGVVDLRNYSLTDDTIPVGDHHVVVDKNQPPGQTRAQPYWNRTETYQIGGDQIVGNPVLVGNTFGGLDMRYRCTYYRVDVGEKPSVDDPNATVVTRAARNMTPFDFTAGRCFNLFDLQPEAFQDAAAGDAWSVFEPPKDDPYVDNTSIDDPNVGREFYYEFGVESLHYEMLNLFVDPDEISPSLRIEAPHGRDQSRDGPVNVRSSEELSTAWVETNREEQAPIPKGDLVLEPDTQIPEDEPGPWQLTFDTQAMVEGGGERPARVDIMRAGIGDDTGLLQTLAEWAANTVCCPNLTTVEIDLPDNTTQLVDNRLVFDFDSVDNRMNDGSGWLITDARITDAADTACDLPIDLSNLADLETSGIASLTEVTVDGVQTPAIAFTDLSTGSFLTPGASTTGQLSFDIGQMDTDDILSLCEDPKLVLTQRQDVESGGPTSAYDNMQVQVSADDGKTWRTVWDRDSRDSAIVHPERQTADVTIPVQLANGQWHHIAYGDDLSDVERRDLRVRLRFDAMDPVNNRLPGWRVIDPKLEPVDGSPVDLVPVQNNLPDPGDEPVWHEPATSERDYAFENRHGTYDVFDSADGGVQGRACRLSPTGSYGGWAGAFQRAPGTGPVKIYARDLAGNVGEFRREDGSGTVLVQDSFESARFTEQYWTHEEFDPANVGFPAYIFDPTMDGMGDLHPEDAPVGYADSALAGKRNGGPGEVLTERRNVLVETPPHNPKQTEIGFTTEGDALVTDGPRHQRALVLTPSNADYDRLPRGLQRVLANEGLFLNATHVAHLENPNLRQAVLNQVPGVMDTVDQLVNYPFQTAANPDQFIDPQAILDELVQALKITAPPTRWGMRDVYRWSPVQQESFYMGLDEYVLDGTPTLPTVAGERLAHQFTYKRDSSTPQQVDLAFDVVARHRMEDRVVFANEDLFGEEFTFANYLINHVSLAKLDIPKKMLESVLGENEVVDQAYADARWMAEHTLADVGITLNQTSDLIERLVKQTASFPVPVADLLNEQGRLQMALPTYGERFGVRVLLENPDGNRTMLAQRDGLFMDENATMRPDESTLAGDAMVTLGPSEEGLYNVSLSMDVNRFEKLRLHLDGKRARELMDQSGDYRLIVESGIRGGDEPAPGVTYELSYSNLEFSVENTGDNEAPNPNFAWRGPIGPNGQATFRPAIATPLLGNLQDQDGFVQWYNWTFPADRLDGFDAAANTTGLRLDGSPIVLDDDDSRVDDLETNGPATAFGSRAQRLRAKIVDNGDSVRLSYQAHGCHTPVVTADFTGSDPLPVTLTVADNEHAESTATRTVRVGGLARSPEFVVDPFATEERPDETHLVWQNNTGSLFLQSRGRALNLTQFIDPPLPPLDELKNKTNLTEALNATALEENTSLTVPLVENATTEADALRERLLNLTERLPDILQKWLLVNPGEVRTTTQVPDNATGGARYQAKLGDMPEPTAIELPKLGDLLNRSIGLADAPDEARLGHDGTDPSNLTIEGIPATNVTGIRNATGVCEPGNATGALADFCTPNLDDLPMLFQDCLLDTWALTYAIHPSKNGEADRNRTLARIVVADTGLGTVLLGALDDLGNVVQLSEVALDNARQELRNIVANVSAIEVVQPFHLVLEATKSHAQPLGQAPSLMASFQPFADGGVSGASLAEIADNLDVQADDLQDGNVSTGELRSKVGEARRLAIAELNNVTAVAENLVDRLLSALGLWCLGPMPEIPIEPLQDDIEAFRENATRAVQRAKDNVNATAEQLNRTIDGLDDAYNDTLPWAQQGWENTVQDKDPEDIQRIAEENKRNITRLVNETDRLLTGILGNLTDLLKQPFADANEAVVAGGPDNLLLSIKYQPDAGEVLLRAGDRVLHEGEIESPHPTQVHQSLRWASLGNRTAEVQAVWDGGGATLEDGFNVGVLDPATWETTVLGPDNTTSDAWVEHVLTPVDPLYQWARQDRSPESAVHRLVDAIRRGDRDLPTATAAEPGRLLKFREHRADVPNDPIANVTESQDAVRTPAELDQASPDDVTPSQHMDQDSGYIATAPAVPGPIEEFRVASGAGTWSAPAITPPPGPPPAPYVFDAREHDIEPDPSHPANHSLDVAFQTTGTANPGITEFSVYATPRPPETDEHGDKLHLGTVDPGQPPSLGPNVGEPGWEPGEDFHVLRVTDPDKLAKIADEWRYIVVQANNTLGSSPYSSAYRIPSTFLEQTFGQLASGSLVDEKGLEIVGDDAAIEVNPLGNLTVNVDTCLGDRVEVVDDQNYPHDQFAAGWGRALRVRESGLDSLFSLVHQMNLSGNRSLDRIPMNLEPINASLPDVDLDVCNALKDLVKTINGFNETQVHDLNRSTLDALNVEPKPDHPPFENTSTRKDPALGRLLGYQELSSQLFLNQTINLTVGDLLYSEPATATWKTTSPDGPFHARARFMIPSVLSGTVGLGTEPLLDRLHRITQVGLLSATVSDERFHLLEVGRLENGEFSEVARVDLDPHLAAPINPEMSARWLEDKLLHGGLVESLSNPSHLPIRYGIRAGDTATNEESVATALQDHWHTIEIYAPSREADVYAVQFDDQWVGQFRTANNGTVPNAIRVGGTNVPVEVIVDDVRFGEAIEPPAPKTRTVRTPEHNARGALRWYMPEDGGAPLTDFNLIRHPLNETNHPAPGENAEIVTSTAAGTARVVSDPDSYRKPAGTRYAYSVQAVNDIPNRPLDASGEVADTYQCLSTECAENPRDSDLGPTPDDRIQERDNVGPPSSAHGVVLPGYLEVSGDASIARNQNAEVPSSQGLEGSVALPTGGFGSRGWRSVLQVNTSQAVNAGGQVFNRTNIGEATLLTYAFATGEGRENMIVKPPTVEDLIESIGYNDNLGEQLNQTLVISSREEAAKALERMAPGSGQYIQNHYGDTTYYKLLKRLEGQRLFSIECPQFIARDVPNPMNTDLCVFATPYPNDFNLCDGESRDLEVRMHPYTCWQDAIAAFPSNSSSYNTRNLEWNNQPRTDYWREADGTDTQLTRSETWRRYDITPAIERDDDGDLSVTLKKRHEHTPSHQVLYAAKEADAWVDDVVGPAGKGPGAAPQPWADGRGPDGYQWTRETASSGDVSVRLDAGGGTEAIQVPTSGISSVPFDVPVKMDVFIPEGKAPREIGLKLAGSLVTRSANSGDLVCQENKILPYTFDVKDIKATVSWGSEVTTPADNLDQILDHAADIQTPRNRIRGIDQASLDIPTRPLIGPEFANDLPFEDEPIIRTGATTGQVDTDDSVEETQELIDDTLVGAQQTVHDLLDDEAGNKPIQMHAGGIPTQRGKWVTLTFDPVQLVLEAAAQSMVHDPGVLTTILEEVGKFQGAETNPWMPDAWANSRAIHERLRPAGFQERVDKTDPTGPFPTMLPFRELTSYTPYYYWIYPWLQFHFSYDKFNELFHCALALGNVELFVEGGTAYVDDLGPDVAPRVRLDGGWATEPVQTDGPERILQGGVR